MYGPQWIVLSEDELRHIGYIRNVATVPGDKLESDSYRPLSGSWTNYELPLFVYYGQPADLEAAQRAWERNLTRRGQLVCVHKALRLLDLYGAGSQPQHGSPCKLDPLMRLRAGDDRAEVERARDLYWRIVREQSDGQSAAHSNTVERAPQPSPPPAVEPNQSRRDTSEEDAWNAALERVGLPVLGNGILYVRCGLGRNGLKWGYPGPPGSDSVPANKWRPLREEALATNHAEFDAGHLDGRTVGEAFLELVIKDPKVQACGAWLSLERPAFRPLFTEGKFPTVDRRMGSSPAHSRDRPMYANVGYPEIKERFRGLPPGTLSGSGPSFTPRAAAHRPNIREWDHKWPLLLDADELSEILSCAYESHANYRDQPFEGPIYHTAKALTDRHRAFFDLLRGRAAQVIADGTTNDGLSVAIQGAQWDRPDRSVDIARSDVWCNQNPGRLIWSGVTFRRAVSSGFGAAGVPAPTGLTGEAMYDDSWLGDIAKWLFDIRSAGREEVSWAEVTERIDEAWLSSKSFGPPSVNAGLLRGKIAEASYNDRPTPSRAKDVPATPQLGTESVRGAPAPTRPAMGTAKQPVGDRRHEHPHKPSMAELAAAKQAAAEKIKTIMKASPNEKTIELEVLKDRWLIGDAKIANLSERGLEAAWHDALSDSRLPTDSPWRKRGPRRGAKK